MKSTVLLIDDDPLDIKPLQKLVESWGIDVITARSGREGLEKLSSTPVDILISDVCMPGMSGEEVAEKVHADHPGLPVVLVTGKGDVKSAVKAMKLGAFDYVLKPPDETELQLTVERAIEHARLRRENEFLRAELSAGGMYGERLIGTTQAMQDVYNIINCVAMTDSTILITGETGTGKELVAQTIHYKSRRSSQPFIAFNCASLNPGLVESELFGHEKGSFTGALNMRRGRFEDADGGTLFLDEIAETSVEFQAKLLRVLQEGEFERLGSNKQIRVDVRLLASTNRNLEQEVLSGNFREDLYYRLKVIPVHLPALRDRREDIPLLATHFAEIYGNRYRQKECTISPEGMDRLKSRRWKGNVRELQHCIERAVILASQDVLGPDYLSEQESPENAGDTGDSLSDVLDARTREHLVSVLDRTGWQKKKAAEILGIDRATLYRLLKKHSITK